MRLPRGIVLGGTALALGMALARREFGPVPPRVTTLFDGSCGF